MITRRSLLLSSACLPLAAPALGQATWPTRQVHLVVPYGPGGGADNFARPLAHQMSQELGQQVVVENRAGASGMIGSAHVAAQPPDGHTLLANFSSLYLAPLVAEKPPYNPVQAFTPITLCADTPQIVVVHPSLPVKNMKELIDYARAHPGAINYVTAGTGTQQHLTGEMLGARTHTKLTHVAYKGGGQAMTDLVGGQVQMGILVLSTVLPQIEAGKLRPIAVIDSERSKLFPQFPTISESGLPGFSMVETFIGVHGPAGMQPALAQQIDAVIQRSLRAPACAKALQSAGYNPKPMGPEPFAVKAREVYATFQQMVKESGIRGAAR